MSGDCLSPTQYRERFGKCFFDADPDERRRISQEYAGYWMRFQDYGGEILSECLIDDEMRPVTIDEFRYPSLKLLLLHNNNSGWSEVHISKYEGRLFVEMKMSEGIMTSIFRNGQTRGFLDDCFGEWDDKRTSCKNEYKDLYASWNWTERTLWVCSVDERRFNEERDEFEWFMSVMMDKLMRLFFDYSNELTIFDTYLPEELLSYLEAWDLIGRKILQMDTYSLILDAKDGWVEIDTDIMFMLSGGVTLGFDMPASSHVYVYQYGDGLAERKGRMGNSKDGQTVADYFSSVIGKRITGYMVDWSRECDMYAYEDKGFDEDQGAFILGLRLLLEDDSVIRVYNDVDSTYVKLEYGGLGKLAID